MEEDPIIDRSKWHKPSYLGHYDENATHYEGIRSRCLKCGASFVFTAQEQKQAFEIEHRYPGYLPSLCPPCSGEWEILEQRILNCEHLWEENRTSLAKDQEFLSGWLALLKKGQPYGKKHFESQVRMLIKAIEDLS
jgi:hypothetical protein